MSIFLIFIILFKENYIYGDVFSSSPEEDNSQDKKVVYLTFDDGPSKNVTDKVLDILKENNVHATFFLIGNQIPELEDTVKRISSEGHSIGLHTYTHKNKYIYASQDNFINEMIKCRNEINKVTGISPNIIRFPCGSRKRLDKSYLERLHKHNFKVYDWNVETSDGINPKLSPDTQYRKAVKESKGLSRIIILMHCDYVHKNTCKTLPRIIRYYKENGYEFKTITENTPEIIQE